MVSKPYSLALLIMSTLSGSLQASETANTDALSVKGKQLLQHINRSSDSMGTFVRADEMKGIYIIQLSEKSALDNEYAAMGDNRSSVVAKTDAQQNRIIKAIKALDSDAVVFQKVRLVDNTLHVQMLHEAAKALQSNDEVLSIVETASAPTLTQVDEFKPFPFLTVNNPNDDITVAIIGNGVDYTHKDLGGEGTEAAYAQAWKNRSNAWDGFPTDTVIGGLDFSASIEGYHTVDYNPIEDRDDEVALDHSYHYPSGTASAALVLKQAPNAKILAYKTWDYDWNFFYAALDVVVDPNQDGDFSDRPDIILVNTYGSGAFYQSKGTGASFETLQIDHLRRLAGLGSLVVSPVGTYYQNTYFSVAALGATPEALTVGSVKVDGDNYYVSSFSSSGPSRGDERLKPDVVAPGEGITAAAAGTGDQESELALTTAYAAASAAGIAARVWDKERNLSALEVKALVANTASTQNVMGIQETVSESSFTVDVTKNAEVPFVGTGVINTSNIDNAKSVLWETSSYQPSLAFGFVEAAGMVSQTREITLKNLTDEPQSYNLSTVKRGEKKNNLAVDFIVPETVSVPARSAISFPVTLVVDGALLSQLPINKTSDFTIDKWAEASVNGYLTFTNTNPEVGDSELNMAWLVFPKKADSYSKSNLSFNSSLFYQSTYQQERIVESGWWLESRVMDIHNTTAEDITAVTMPLMHYKYARSEQKSNLQGHIIQSLGAMIYPVDIEQCESGQALGVSIEMFDPFELAMAEHRDRFSVLAHFTIYNATYADAEGDDPLMAEQMATDADRLASIMIELDENDQPVTTYIDMSMPYDPWNPNARYNTSSLQTYVAPGGKIAMANICMDDLFREEYPDIESWKENLGWQFGTDRDAVPAVDESLIRFNPVLGGTYSAETIDHTGEDGYPYWWDWNCQPTAWDPNYCIEQSVKVLASSSSMAIMPDDIAPGDVVLADLNWTPILTLPSGSTAKVAGGLTAQCDPNVVSAGNWIVDERCPPGFLFFELNNNQIYKYPSIDSDDTLAVDGQSFNVYEGAENGTVVGTIAISSAVFFALDENATAQAFLMNSLPGTPFAVSTSGEITVINGDALDYESINKSYVLNIQVDHVNRASEIVDVTVNVSNKNDVAPTQTQTLDTISATRGQSLTVNVSGNFTDAEGDGVTFFSTNLPQGLAISAGGDITGTPEVSGNFTATLTASDGVNETQASLDFTITSSGLSGGSDSPQSETNISGGSIGLWTLLLSGLGLAIRRNRKL